MLGRSLLKLASAAALTAILPEQADAAPLKLLFVHGRGQGGLNPDDLRTTWLDALKQGATAVSNGSPLTSKSPFHLRGRSMT
jgi:hypothetical protein